MLPLAQTIQKTALDFWTKQNIMSMLAQVRDQAFLECLFAKTDKIDPFLMLIFVLYIV